MKKYNLVVCGGTFDLFHKGHKEFLDFVLDQGKKVLIGVTSDSYVAQFKPSLHIDSFEVRKKALVEYLFVKNAFDKAEIVEIHDIYGPTVSNDLRIDALIVTTDTQEGAETINKKRHEHGLSPLTVIVCRLSSAEDGKETSSTRIRNGEINRDGRLSIKPEWFHKTLYLPEHLRSEFQKPAGEVIPDFKKWYADRKNLSEVTVTVGDIISSEFNALKIDHVLSIIDFIVERKKRFASIEEEGFTHDVVVKEVVNHAGSVTGDLFRVVYEVMHSMDKKNYVIKVDGEEDLAVLPVVLAAPLGASVFYGQPRKGVVRVEVGEETKERAHKLLGMFDIE